MGSLTHKAARAAAGLGIDQTIKRSPGATGRRSC